MQAPYEGAFASRVLGYNLETLAPFRSAPAGPGAWSAGLGGVLQGRFGWGNPQTGQVLNTPTTPQDVLGVVVPLQSVNAANGGVIGGPAAFGGPQAAWTWQTWDRTFRAWRLRQGLVANLALSGKFWLKFVGGASYGNYVFASTVDGSAIASPTNSPLTGGQLTPFRICGNGGPGKLIVVSSTSSFT